MKKKINRSNRRKQQGVALLFALGVLSLLLILGLASVTNALLAQRVASNNSSRSQAKMLAQSAISRLAISLMYYQHQASNVASPTIIPSSYDSIYSLYSDSTGTLPIQATDGLRNSDGSELGSKLLPPSAMTPTGFVSNPRAQWSYFSTEDNDKNKRIVGRVAYQYLPTGGASAQINLDHVLHGVYSQGDPTRTPWNDRWGAGINELNLNETTVFKGWDDSSNPEAPASSDDLVASVFDAFFAAYGNSLFSTSAAAKEAWVRRWFGEGTVASDPEYYRYDDTSGSTTKHYYFHRFPLGTLDKSTRDPSNAGIDAWYDRLTAGYSASSANPNSEAILGRLANPGVEFKLSDSITANKVGIPFLKYLSDVKGSFTDITSRRKQIAANLNDYCDSDSIPSSNVEASTWSTILDDSGSWPKYTGNEKTPYINEFALMFNVVPEIVNPDSSSMQVKLTLTPTVLAELIDIYELKPATADTYKMFLNLKQIQIVVDITGEGDYSIPGTPATTGSFSTTGSKTFTFTPTAPMEIDFGSDAWKTNGYAVAGTVLRATPSDSASAPVSISQTLDLGLSSYPGINSVTGVKTSFKISSASFTVQGITLVDKDGSGVDFVRWNQNISTSSTAIPAKILFTAKAGATGVLTLANSSDSFGLNPQDQALLIAGMQAKDPRQNLNVSTTAASSDWSDLSVINWAEYGYDSTDLLTMNLDLTKATLAEQILGGLVNKDSNPSGKSSAGTAAAGTLGDVETATDPAWLEDPADTATVGKHLSTAFIRNAPMESPWELGAIHRGAPWETINLKNAMKPGSTTEPITPEDMEQFTTGNGWNGAVGTSYVGGDGGILEQIKMTDKAYCYGKLNVNMLSSSTTVNPDYTSADDEIGRSLFFKLRYGQNLGDLTNLTTPGGTQITWADTATVVSPLQSAVTGFRTKYGSSYSSAFENRAQFLCWEDSSGNSLSNGFGILAATWATSPDAKREELIGKTIDLLNTNSNFSNTFRFIVVAQTIRDLDGTVARVKNDGTVGTKSCAYGTFDVEADGTVSSLPASDQFTYYDQITGEVKMLVTMENNPVTGQTIVRQVEYIE